MRSNPTPIPQQPFSIRMPEMVSCDVFASPRTGSKAKPAGQSDQALQQHLQRIALYLKNKFSTWRIDNEFKFDLPTSSFQNRRQKPVVEFRKRQGMDDTVEMGPLTLEQLQSIHESAEFNVFSSSKSLPYRWHISAFIYKGHKKTCDTLHANLGFCFNILYMVKQHIIGQQWFSLRTRCYNVGNYFRKMARLFVGIPTYINTGYSVDPVFYMEMERHLDIYDNYWNTFDRTLFEFLYVNTALQGDDLKRAEEAANQREEYLVTICDRFLDAWEERFEQIKKNITERLPQEQFQQICRTERHKVQERIVRELRVDPRLFNHMKLLVEEEQTIRDVVNQYKLRTERSEKALKQQMQQHYTVKKYSQDWFNSHYKTNVAELRLQNRQQMLERLRRKLRSPHFHTYVHFMTDYESKLLQIQHESIQYKPTRIFIIKYKLFPPYRVECRDGVHYQLLKQDEVHIATDTCFWRVMLYAVRYMCWTKNAMYYAFRNMAVGKLGILNIFWCRRYHPIYMVNPETGEIGKYPGIQRTPVALQAVQTWNYVSEARQKFQQEPDTGICSKMCSRIFNIIFLYGIVMFGYVFLYVLIIKPILIIIVSLFYLVIFLTAWIWMPIVLLVHYLFSLFVYNMDHDFQKDTENQFSELWMPVIISTLKFVLDIMVFVMVLIIIVLSPILAIGLAALSVARFCLRLVYDFITYNFIKCCARQPKQDSWIAWKVAGPGVSRNFYQTIKEEDLYVLILAELEKVRLQLYQKYVIDKLNEPIRAAKAIASQFTTQLNMMPNFAEAIQPPIIFYTNKLNSQIQEAKRVYPELPGSNVRFTQDQIDLYAANTKKMIKDLVSRYPSHDIFNILNVKSKRYDKVVIAVWQRIFGTSAVFERLQNIDERFQVTNDNEGDVARVFKKLNKGFKLLTKDKIQEQGHFIYKPVIKIKSGVEVSEDKAMFQKVGYKDIIKYVKASSGKQLPHSKDSPEYSIIPNLNILTIYEKQRAAGNLLQE